MAVHKPLDWTSQDVVAYVRRMLEKDARDRGADVAKMGRKRKSQQIKVGHGGTLDPMASGVLVIGVGKGTKQLQQYLNGSKGYKAMGKFGTETSTLDLDPTGDVVKEKPWEHVTEESLQQALPKFMGTISQVPPLFSAKRVNGKRLYELARDGKIDASKIKIEPKQVQIYSLTISDVNLPDFTISMEVGGGTFVRSLIRDIAYEVDSVATTTLLQRTKQGPFLLEHCLDKDDWTPDNIYARIVEWNEKFSDGSLQMEAPKEPKNEQDNTT
jgi:tRNA pseudouridine55 synthase